MRALRPILSDPEVTELCINRPGEAFVETRKGWERRPLPFADFDWCRRLAKLIANSTRQRIDEATPSALRLPSERGARPDRPAAGDDAPAPSRSRCAGPPNRSGRSAELAERGIFRATRRSSRGAR